jgi:MinD-like ATPase involved in chromosome partitioning or flagellar assembly
MPGSNGASPIARSRGRIVVLLSGHARANLPAELEARRDLVLRNYTSSADSRTPIESVDVVLHVTGADSPVAREIAALREQTNAPIVLGLVGDREGLVDEALEALISDILILPQPPNVIAFALRKAARGRATGQARASRVIMVSSTKGGTGKTSLAVNLAVGLAETRVRTLLIDLDVQFGDVGIVLGLDRPQRTLHDLAAAAGDLDAEKLRGYVVRHGSGLHVVPAPLRPEEGEAIDAARIATVLQTARGMYDAIVVDTAPLFDGPMLTALDRSDQVLLVTTPDVPSMKNVRLAFQTLDLLGFPVDRVALVANRSGMPGGASAGEVAETIGRQIRFVLPEDATVPSSINSGIPAAMFDPKSRYSAAVRAIVSELVSDEEIPAGRDRERDRRFRLLGIGR